MLDTGRVERWGQDQRGTWIPWPHPSPSSPPLSGCLHGTRGGGGIGVYVTVTTHSVCAQWLQRIEETESALQRKMVDLESEKVSSVSPWCPCSSASPGRVSEAKVQVIFCLYFVLFCFLFFRSCSVNRRATWMRSWTTGSRPSTKPTR